MDTLEEGKIGRKDASDPLANGPGPRPQEVLQLDPAVQDLEAPFAGLRVQMVGSAWGQSERVVILLHGYGAQGDDLSSLATRFHEEVPGTYLLPEAPFALGEIGRAWFKRDRENFDEGLSYAQALVD